MGHTKSIDCGNKQMLSTPDFLLPQSEAATRHLRQVSGTGERSEPAGKVSILVVDDNPKNLMSMEAVLGGLDLDVVTAESGRKALKQLLKRDFAAILLDVNMPEMDGFEAAELIRQREKSRYTPIIFVSSEKMDESYMIDGYSHGAMDYILKPFSPETLKAKVAILVDLYNKTEALKNSEAQLRSIIESNADGMLVLDSEGMVLFLNPAIEEIMGQKAAELQGELFGYPLVAGGKVEIEIQDKAGDVRFVEMQVRGIQWEGKDAYLASFRDFTEHKRMEEELLNLSLIDDLTGLHNRRGFITLAEQHMKIVRRQQAEFAILFADLDGLKTINDTYGHECGSQALAEIAFILKNTLRDSDIIARVGGDEFVVLALDAKKDEAGALINRLQECLDVQNREIGRPYALSLSFGVAYYEPEHPCSLDELISSADASMYEQKKKKARSVVESIKIPDGAGRGL